MRKIKKLIIVLLAIFLLIAVLASCNKEQEITVTSEKLTVIYTSKQAEIKNDEIAIVINLTNGYFNITDKKSGKNLVENAYAEASTKEHSVVTTKDYGSGNVLVAATEITDIFGKGLELKITYSSDEKPTLTQYFYVYENIKTFYTKISIKGDAEKTQSNYLAPLVLNKEDNSLLSLDKSFKDMRFLEVPYDNNEYESFDLQTLVGTNKTYFSSEVTVMFDINSLNSVCMGSLEHDNFKSGIEVEKDKNNITNLKLYAGAANRTTRDYSIYNGILVGEEHGYVVSDIVYSPLMYISFMEDYRDALEDFSVKSAIVTPPLAWDGGVVFGWNSWSALANELTYDALIAISNYFKNENTEFNNDGVVYINYDSYWSHITEEELDSALEYISNNGQKTGAYDGPFSYWGNAEQSTTNIVPGTVGMEFEGEILENGMTWDTIILKDSKGNLTKKNSGDPYSVDPTHPGTLKMIDYKFANYKRRGISYIKFDFMNFGANEGVFYNKNITTGTQAYNFGMQYIVDVLSKENIGWDVFISLSIAPIFPSQYAHARRISCDTFGDISNSEYMLNSLTYGWWMNENVYPYNDPDHTVLYNTSHVFGDSQPYSLVIAQTRFNASVIAGTVMLLSDNVQDQNAKDRLNQITANAELNKLASLGKTFRPYSYSEGNKAQNIYYLNHNGKTYIAVFNFDRDNKLNLSIDLTKVGLTSNTIYNVNNLNNNETLTAKSLFEINLNACQSFIFELTK